MPLQIVTVKEIEKERNRRYKVQRW